jgi:hypothetical protein
MIRLRMLIVVTLAGVLAGSTPAFAQGQSQSDHGNGNKGNSGGNAKGGSASGVSSTPNQTVLPPPTVSVAGTGPSTVTPFAWVDNAAVMPSGSVWVGLSMVRWQGSGLSEVNLPVIDAAIGLTPRAQLGVSMPHVMGSSEPTGSPGGWGTTFVNAKLLLVQDTARRFNLTVAPTLEILSAASMQSSPAGRSRAQWGLPVSMDVDRGTLRLYGSAGYFSPGVWFSGAGIGTLVKNRVGVAMSFSRSWTSAVPDPASEAPRRNDVSGSASTDLTPHIGVFASLSRTIATTAMNGAGTSISIGMSLTAAPALRTK